MDRCANCSAELSGPYCAQCGQRSRDLRESFWHLVSEALHEAFELDSRIMRTIVPFLVRPGFLAREYIDGRRMRYSSPLRLYLFCSFAFFFLAQLSSIRAGNVHFQADLRPEQLEKMRSQGRVGRWIATFVEKTTALDKDSTNSGKRFVAAFTNQLPKVAFGLLPVFALLLKLPYRKIDAYYVDHLILAVQLHAFAFFVGALTETVHLGSKLDLVGLAVVSVYAFVALRTFYRQSWLRTTWKFVALGSLYLIPLTIGLAVAVVAAIWTA